MALNIEQQTQFRNWVIKSSSVPVLSVVCVAVYWLSGSDYAHFHFWAAACLLFGGFPLWNIVLEKDRGWLLLYHGSHFMACFCVFMINSRSLMLPAPSEFCLIIGSWCLAKEGLRYLMPATDKRVEDMINWRKETLDTMVKSHYYVAEDEKVRD